MATLELTTGEYRSHETLELRGGFIYPVSSVLEIDPGESEIKGAPPAGDGMLFTPE